MRSALQRLARPRLTARSRRADVECAIAVELVTDHLDGRLDPDLHHLVERHLSRCGGCRVYVEQVRGVERALGAARPLRPDPHTRDQLLALYRDARRTLNQE